ncbi:GNAT family N-acetyltransferase [Paraburkholderia fungorum]|uniref:GNAT family N-acetyltransferase n=1 Tax=Paraburkholderia fungorum TaxID=134537 RepID=UPI0038BB49AD
MVPSVKEQFKDDYLLPLYEALLRMSVKPTDSAALRGTVKEIILTRIRPVAPTDARSVARLVDALLVELHNGELEPADRVCIAEAVLAQTSRNYGYLAFEGDSPVGVLLMTEGMAIYAGGAFGQITELYVQPQFRSGGVAAALVREAVKFGKERGWKRLDVGAPDQHRWARTLAFYLSAGFVEVGPRLRLDL